VYVPAQQGSYDAAMGWISRGQPTGLFLAASWNEEEAANQPWAKRTSVNKPRAGWVLVGELNPRAQFEPYSYFKQCEEERRFVGALRSRRS
jgi:hypothetical protein